MEFTLKNTSTMHQYMTYFDCSLCWKSEALSPTVWSDTQ